MVKSDFWQAVRGICIIAVVLIHCKYDYTTLGSFDFNYGIVIRQIINFPVAIFFFLSGYFLNVSKIKLSQKEFYKTRVTRLFLPFIFWSIFYLSISALKNPESVNILSLLICLIIGNAAVPFYYLVVLFQFTILTPWLIDVIEKRFVIKWALWFLTPVYLGVLYFIRLELKLEMPLYGTWFPAWFCFYYFGMNAKLAMHENGNPLFDNWIFKKYSLLFVLIGLLASLLEAKKLIAWGASPSFISSQIKYSSFLYTFALIFLLLHLSKQHIAIPQILKKIGDFSFGIYLVHIFWLTIFRLFYNFTNVNISFLPLVQFCQLLFTLILSFIFIKFTKYILPDKFCKIIGF